MDVDDASAARHAHVALTEKLLGTHFTGGWVRRFEADLEADTGREVGLDRTGNNVDRPGCVAMMRWMLAARAIWQDAGQRLRYPCLQPSSGRPYLVDDDHDVGIGVRSKFFRNIVKLPTRFLVEAGLTVQYHGFALPWRKRRGALKPLDVAHAEAGHLAIAFFHLRTAHLRATTAFSGR